MYNKTQAKLQASEMQDMLLWLSVAPDTLPGVKLSECRTPVHPIQQCAAREAGLLSFDLSLSFGNLSAPEHS